MNQPNETHDGLSRRTVVRGAAWSVPVVAFAGAAPAFAASLPPGLQGWVTVAKRCRWTSQSTLEIDGRGSYPDRGLWIYNTRETTTIADAKITYYFPNSLGTLTWQAAAGNSRWSVPAVDNSAPVIAGHTAYTSTYTGGWQFVDSPGDGVDYTYATGQPHFSANLSYSSCQRTITAYARRSVIVNGETIDFTRGPINL